MREALAKLAHEQWSGWMKYLFSKSIPYKPGEVQAEVGAVIIPKWAVDRWKRQMRSSFAELSAKERDSDRTEADKFLAVLNAKELKKELK